MAVHLQNGLFFFSGACLPPTMAQNMKIPLTSQNKCYNVTQEMFIKHEAHKNWEDASSPL
jgi:hypothetical protein